MCYAAVSTLYLLLFVVGRGKSVRAVGRGEGRSTPRLVMKRRVCSDMNDLHLFFIVLVFTVSISVEVLLW